MSNNQQEQPSQGSGGAAQPKSAPETPKATPPKQRTNTRNDGKSKDDGVIG